MISPSSHYRLSYVNLYYATNALDEVFYKQYIEIYSQLTILESIQNKKIYNLFNHFG